MSRILIIEDDTTQRETYKDILVQAGYEVLEAPDGVSGMQQYRQQPCDLVITDIYMPNQDGLETILKLKEEFPMVKIIAVSGGGTRAANIRDSGMKLAIEAATGFGADYVLQKPVSRQQLLHVIEEVLHDSGV